MVEIKTINTGEKIPDEFYISLIYENNFMLDQLNRANYINTKKIKSTGFNNVFIEEKRELFRTGDINYLPLATEIMTESLSPFIMKTSDRYNREPNILNIQNYNVELDMELIRQKYYKKYPSRFSGIFAFGDVETCKKVCLKHGWDLNTFKKFKLIDSGEFNDYRKVGKFNMDIISLLKDQYIHVLPKKQDELINNYWRCSEEVKDIEIYNTITCNKEQFNIETIYEYVIEGILKEIP